MRVTLGCPPQPSGRSRTSHEHEIEDDGSADPLKQAAPDAELAEEQLEFARPDEPEPGEEADEEEFEQEVEESIAAAVAAVVVAADAVALPMAVTSATMQEAAQAR